MESSAVTLPQVILPPQVPSAAPIILADAAEPPIIPLGAIEEIEIFSIVPMYETMKDLPLSEEQITTLPLSTLERLLAVISREIALRTPKNYVSLVHEWCQSNHTRYYEFRFKKVREDILSGRIHLLDEKGKIFEHEMLYKGPSYEKNRPIAKKTLKKALAQVAWHEFINTDPESFSIATSEDLETKKEIPTNSEDKVTS